MVAAGGARGAGAGAALSTFDYGVPRHPPSGLPSGFSPGFPSGSAKSLGGDAAEAEEHAATRRPLPPVYSTDGDRGSREDSGGIRSRSIRSSSSRSGGGGGGGNHEHIKLVPFEQQERRRRGQQPLLGSGTAFFATALAVGTAAVMAAIGAAAT